MKKCLSILLLTMILAGCTPAQIWHARDFLLVDDRVQGRWLTDQPAGSVTIDGNQLTVTAPTEISVEYEVVQVCCTGGERNGLIVGRFVMMSEYKTAATFDWAIEDDIMIFRWRDVALNVSIVGRVRLQTYRVETA